MEPAVGAWCTGSEVCFRLHDRDRRLTGVRLRTDVVDGAPEFAYVAAGRIWELRLPRPPVWRMEYRLELTRRDGGVQTVCDPDNPLRAGGGYGDSSELRCPGYREPDWVQLPAAPGGWRDVYLPLPAVKGETVARIWSPAVPADQVVVAHDGPDYHRYGQLGRYCAAMIGAGRVPPHHLVLLPPGERFEWYSASPAYARALTGDVLPKLAAELGTDRPVVGVGASLGGLAMLHAQRRHPDRFAGLFLQSGSFFQPRFDRQESGFPRWLRIVRFTGRVLRDTGGPAVPAALTCGAAEENLANNRDMAAALGRHGYPVSFAEVPDAHTWVGWRDALDPHLTSLLQHVF
ncbi:MAG TPA: alpha/beta hydrolase-fold protein [Actinoplanes sp.]|nr:alpha/beta hydrolase-fold protein [Actinoplanes sp.]